MRINTNVSALTAANSLGRVQDAIAKSSEKLSSGFRINHAADDAAGLGIANTMRGDIKALTMASNNAQQASSMLSIADGAASSIQKLLERMKELAAQSASDTVDDTARAKIQVEYASLQAEIDRTTNTVQYQNQKLLAGTYGATIATNIVGGGWTKEFSRAAAGVYTFSAAQTLASNKASLTDANGTTQIITAVTGQKYLTFDKLGITIDTGTTYTANVNGASAGTNDTKTFTVTAGTASFLVGAAHAAYTGDDVLSVTGSDLDLTTATLGVSTGASTVSSRTTAAAGLVLLDAAIASVATTLGVIGAAQNRMGSAIDNVKTTIQNFSSAESVIRDVDMATEMVTFSKNNILAQAGTAMLAQANQAGQSVLKLLQ